MTIDCAQGNTLIDCDRGFNGGNYSDLSRTFAWNRTTSVAQQVSIVFRFDQQINISRITMFFWNSQNNSIPLVHPSLLGCVPLNTFDLIVLCDNGESGIEPACI